MADIAELEAELLQLESQKATLNSHLLQVDTRINIVKGRAAEHQECMRLRCQGRGQGEDEWAGARKR